MLIAGCGLRRVNEFELMFSELYFELFMKFQCMS